MNRLLMLVAASSLLCSVNAFAGNRGEPDPKSLPAKGSQPVKKDDKPVAPPAKVEPPAAPSKKVEPPAAPPKKGDESATPAPKDTKPIADAAEMEKKWLEVATPGPMHTWLENLEGKWSGTATETGFDGKSVESVCSINNTMRYHRFLESTYQGKSMGKQFYGQGTLGYNNAAKKFESTWYDNQGTGTIFMTGAADSAGKVVTLSGSTIDPTSGKNMPMACVYTITSSNSYKMRVFAPNAATGKEENWLTCNFTRESGAKEDKKVDKKDDKPDPKKKN